MNLVKPAEVYTYGFGWRKFKTVGVSPIKQFIETLLDVSFNDIDVFRAITDQEIVHVERANALVRSTKMANSSDCCSRHFTCNWQAVNIMSAVCHPALKPHYPSGKIPMSLTCFVSWLSISPRIDSKEIHR